MQAKCAHVFLLLMYVANLEPDVFFGERPWRVGHDVFEALSAGQHHEMRIKSIAYLQTLTEFLLLFVDDAKSEVDLVGLFEIRLHPHNLREGFFGMLKRSIAIVEYANAIPQLGLLFQQSQPM